VTATDSRTEELRERVKAHSLARTTVEHIFNKPFWLQRLLAGLLDHQCAIYPCATHVTAYPGGLPCTTHTLWSGYFTENVLRLHPTFDLGRFIQELHPKRRDKVLVLFQEALDEMPKEDPYDLTQLNDTELNLRASKLFDRANHYHFQPLSRWAKVLSLHLAARGCNMKIYDHRIELMVKDTGEVHCPYRSGHSDQLNPNFKTATFLAEFPADQIEAVAAELNQAIGLMPAEDPYREAG
jgi:uncharacterized Zn-finger protein